MHLCGHGTKTKGNPAVALMHPQVPVAGLFCNEMKTHEIPKKHFSCQFDIPKNKSEAKRYLLFPVFGCLPEKNSIGHG